MVRGLVVLAALGLMTSCTPEEIQAYFDLTEQHHDVLSGEQLKVLRDCESGDDYTAVSSNGRYRGAYQFSRSTWNGVARRHYPWLDGLDPAEADTWWQDAQARALWSEQGSSPWPHCGARVR
jgi:hypothetical protein